MIVWSRLALLGSILLFLPQLWDLFESPKAVAVRILGAGAVAMAIAEWRRRPTPRPRLQLLDIAFLTWLAIELVTTIASTTPRLSFFGDDEHRDEWLTALGFAGVYLSARLGTRSAAVAAGTLGVMVVAAAGAGAHALLQLLGLDPLPWSHSTVYAGGAFDRPFGTLGHPNHLGVVTASAAAIALARVWEGGPGKWAWVLAGAVLGAAVIATLSRAAWLAAAAGTLITLALVLAASAPEKRPVRAAGVTVAAGILLLAIAFAASGMLRSRLAELISPSGASSRLEIWRTAIAMWRDHPWLGSGPDTFGLHFQRYQTPAFWTAEWGMSHQHAHSIYLNVLATRGLLGVAGAVFVAAVTILTLRRAWRRGMEERRAVAPIAGALAAIAVGGAFGAIGVAGATMVAVCLGTTAALGAPQAAVPAVESERGPAARRQRARDASHSRDRTARIHPPFHRDAWIAIAAAAVVMALHGNTVRASHAAYLLRSLSSEADPLAVDPELERALDEAERRARGSDAIQRLRARIFLARVAALEPVPRDAPRAPAEAVPDGTIEAWLDDAERSARRAIALVPLRSGNHQTLGRVLLARVRHGDPRSLEAAAAAYRRCWALSPVNSLAMLQFAFEARELGRPDVALPVARRAAALYPDESLGHVLVGFTELDLGDTAIARSSLERAMAGTWRGVPYPREVVEQSLEALRLAARSR